MLNPDNFSVYIRNLYGEDEALGFVVQIELVATMRAHWVWAKVYRSKEPHCRVYKVVSIDAGAERSTIRLSET